VGIFVDVCNLYYCLQKKYKNRKLDYGKYLEFLQTLGKTVHAIAYGAHVNNEAKPFIIKLKKLGYVPKFKTPKKIRTDTGEIFHKADWDVGMVVDIVDLLDDLDVVVLGTADGDLAPLVEWVKRHNKTVVIFGCRISSDLKACADVCIEIPASLLETRNETVKNG
jgi:uncharacterized LabA/DUF88 family protein